MTEGGTERCAVEKWERWTILAWKLTLLCGSNAPKSMFKPSREEDASTLLLISTLDLGSPAVCCVCVCV